MDGNHNDQELHMRGDLDLNEMLETVTHNFKQRKRANKIKQLKVQSEIDELDMSSSHTPGYTPDISIH